MDVDFVQASQEVAAMGYAGLTASTLCAPNDLPRPLEFSLSDRVHLARGSQGLSRSQHNLAPREFLPPSFFPPSFLTRHEQMADGRYASRFRLISP